MKKDNKELKKTERRKMELARKKQRTKMVTIVAVIIVAIITVGAIFAVSLSDNPTTTNPIEPVEPSPPAVNDEVKILTSEISENAKFYKYTADDGTEVKYFAVIGTDGGIHVALDACDVCYNAKKGYIQENDVMKCINCGRTFEIVNIGADNTAGGCWPSFIPITINEDEVIINTSDLEDKTHMF